MINHLRAAYWSIKSALLFCSKNFTLQYHYPDARFSFPINWICDDFSMLKIGTQVNIGAFSEIVVESTSAYSSICGQLVIGDRVVIGSHANIRASGGKIHIGRDCLIAQQVSLIAAGHSISTHALYREAPWDTTKTGIVIHENVWIGAGVTVLPGCSIGRNAVIGAGSVVTKSIPANEIWAGIPARRVRTINRLEAIEQHSECQVIPCSSI